MGMLHQHTWVYLFQANPSLLLPLLSWLCQLLRLISGTKCSQAFMLKNSDTGTLCLSSLEKELLVKLLELNRRKCTAIFVHHLTGVTV